MMKKELQTQSQRKYVNKTFLLLLVLIGLINCGKQKDYLCGFTLQEFEVINPKLKLLIEGVRDSCYMIDTFEKEVSSRSVSVIDFIKNDSIIEIGFISVDKRSLSDTHIFEENRRIVGYLNIEKDTFIVLSNINSWSKFYDILYKFMIPTGNKQRFEYVFFPDNLYCRPEDEIFCPPLIFYDPHYYWYTFKDGKFIYQEDFHDIKRE